MTDARLAALAASRWKVQVTLTTMMVALYFGFILLIAYNKPLLARLIAPGLSLGIFMGALVILLSWLLTWVYVHWANTRYDTALDRLRQ